MTNPVQPSQYTVYQLDWGGKKLEYFVLRSDTGPGLEIPQPQLDKARSLNIKVMGSFATDITPKNPLDLKGFSQYILDVANRAKKDLEHITTEKKRVDAIFKKLPFSDGKQ